MQKNKKALEQIKLYNKVQYGKTPYEKLSAEEKKTLSVEEFNKINDGEWWQILDMDDAKTAWQKNLKACQDAIEYHYKKDRPLEILVVHGSGRHPTLSCAHETSNSELILETGLKALSDEVNIERVKLREYKIETCNGCVSTASYVCNFPCSCYADDPMHKLYPKVLKADVLLMSTGVNQSAMSTRMKAFADRLVSLDGGMYIKELPVKDAKFRSEMIKLSQNSKSPYDPRMFNRVAAYFIASKDHENEREALQLTEETIPDHLKKYCKPLQSPLSYGELVAWSLADGYRDFQMWHADPWYVVGAGNPEEEYSYDKNYYNSDESLHSMSKKVVLASVALAEEIRRNPPKWEDMPKDRNNRT